MPMQRVQVQCMVGGKAVVTTGISSTTKVMASYPLATITVYLTGTSTLATIYSDNISTPQANPFTANLAGYGYFYAANGRYDVQVSGGSSPSLPSPITYGDILVFDPATAGVSSPIYSLSALGTLAIQSNIAPIAITMASVTPSSVRFDVKSAPTGAGLIASLYQAGVLWLTLTIPDGLTTIAASGGQLVSAGAIVAGRIWRLDITQVGSTFPGADITATIQ